MALGKITASHLLILIAVCWLVVLVGIPLGLAAYRARRPSDMPADAIWIDAPAVPFGFYRGWWLGCWVDTDGQANRCRLGTAGSIVYEGGYVPCEGKGPVPNTELKLKAPINGSNMWSFPGVIVWLQDGRFLVPAQNVGECEKIRHRLKHAPE